jgi:hypothetical protein
MGWNLENWCVSVRTSSHNSKQDEIDQQLWEELKARLEELISEPQFEPISPIS